MGFLGTQFLKTMVLYYVAAVLICLLLLLLGDMLITWAITSVISLMYVPDTYWNVYAGVVAGQIPLILLLAYLLVKQNNYDGDD